MISIVCIQAAILCSDSLKNKKITLQGIFYHNKQTRYVYEDAIFSSMEKPSSIKNFTLRIFYKACSDWQDYKYADDMSLIRPKLDFRLLFIHLVINTFVFQDKELEVFYINKTRLMHAFKAIHPITFFRSNYPIENLFGLSFLLRDGRIFAFRHEKGILTFIFTKRIYPKDSF